VRSVRAERAAQAGRGQRVRAARRAWAAWLFLLALGGPGGHAGAVSLWEDSTNLFRDGRARGVGDLVTIVIVEEARASQSATTKTGKEASVEIGPWGGLLAQLVGPELTLSLQAGAQDRLEGGGTTTRGGSLRARMTARVVEVLPNGNLVIEGHQSIRVNGEEQEIVVSGIVRPQDIRPDNTVLSTHVADARIVFQGSGTLGEKQRPGLLTRLFRWLF